MELYQLRYFCAVARTGSFTKAAEAESVSQPSLSEAVRKLEAELGAPLLQRLGRGVRLTEHGDRFLPHAKQILQDVASAKRAVGPQDDGEPGGKLTAGCIPTIMPYFLAPRIREFTALYPQVELQLVEDRTSRLIEKLQNAQIDVAVLALPIKHPNLVTSELFREPLLLATAENDPIARANAVPVRAIRNQRFLLLREGHCLREEVLGACRKAKLILNTTFETDQLSTILSLAASGFGTGIVPAMAANPASKCRFVPLSPPAERRIGFVRLSQGQSAALKRFTGWLRQITRAAS